MRKQCVLSCASSYPAGFTMLEVVVALVLFALILGVSGLALASLREPTGAEKLREFEQARIEAIRTGRPVSVAVSLKDTGELNAQRTTHFSFLPDGRVVGGGIDMLTGASHGTR